MTKAKKTTHVCVSRCEHCGLERYGFRPHTPGCPRCGRTRQSDRWISEPHPETVERARRENPTEG